MSVWVQSWSEHCWASVLNPVCPHQLNLTVGKVAGLATHLCIHCVAPLSSQAHQTLNRTIFWLKCSQQDQNYVDCCDTATVFGSSLQSLPQGFNHITSRTSMLVFCQGLFSVVQVKSKGLDGLKAVKHSRKFDSWKTFEGTVLCSQTLATVGSTNNCSERTFTVSILPLIS